jgi:hypothetical protein
LKEVQYPANRFCPSTQTFVDGLIAESHHIIVVPYSKPPEEAEIEYFGIFC